jgi:hypothetical protein
LFLIPINPNIPYSLFLLHSTSTFLVPCSLFKSSSTFRIPCSLFIQPQHSVFLVPCSLFIQLQHSLFLVHYSNQAQHSLFLVPCSFNFNIPCSLFLVHYSNQPQLNSQGRCLIVSSLAFRERGRNFFVALKTQSINLAKKQEYMGN